MFGRETRRRTTRGCSHAGRRALPCRCRAPSLRRLHVVVLVLRPRPAPLPGAPRVPSDHASPHVFPAEGRRHMGSLSGAGRSKARSACGLDPPPPRRPGVTWMDERIGTDGAGARPGTLVRRGSRGRAAPAHEFVCGFDRVVWCGRWISLLPIVRFRVGCFRDFVFTSPFFS